VKRRLPLIWHIAFWIALWLVSALAYPLSYELKEPGYTEPLVRQFIFLFGKIALTYWSIYFLFPRFFITRRYTLFVVYFILSLLTATALQRLINFELYYTHIYPKLVNTKEEIQLMYWDFTPIVQTILVLYPPAMVALFARAVKQWYDTQHKMKEAEKEQLLSELKYLQSQIHPHFFFNTLNNLYGLSRAKSDLAPEIILKLSNLMRYMLYETNVAFVPVQKECSHLYDYIDLEKIRYKDGFDIFFKVRGDIQQALMPPLLLLPFIENAFKHGFSESVQHAWISIDIEVKDKELLCKVENSLPQGSKTIFTETNGLGIPNVKRRLNLLYKDDYELNVRITDTVYTVDLTIPVQTIQ